MCEWYDGYVIKNETTESLMSKLKSCRLTLSSNAANYINNLLTTYIELKEIPCESISDSHVLSLFPNGITDPYFQMPVEIQRKNDRSLMDAVIYVSKNK